MSCSARSIRRGLADRIEKRQELPYPTADRRRLARTLIAAVD